MAVPSYALGDEDEALMKSSVDLYLILLKGLPTLFGILIWLYYHKKN